MTRSNSRYKASNVPYMDNDVTVEVWVSEAVVVEGLVSVISTQY